MRIYANKLGYPIWCRCQTVLLSQWFYPFHIHLPLQIPCKTLIAEEFIMNCALIKSLVVNRVKVFAFTCLLHSS